MGSRLGASGTSRVPLGLLPVAERNRDPTTLYTRAEPEINRRPPKIGKFPTLVRYPPVTRQSANKEAQTRPPVRGEMVQFGEEGHCRTRRFSSVGAPVNYEVPKRDHARRRL